jgi:hypothetical protein
VSNFPIDFVWPPRWLPASDEWKNAWAVAHPELMAVLVSDDPSEVAMRVRVTIVQNLIGDWALDHPGVLELEGEDVLLAFEQQRQLSDIVEVEGDDGVHP